LVAAGYKVVLHYPIYTPAGANGGATDQAATAFCKQYQSQIDALINGSTILRGDVVGYQWFIDHLDNLGSDQTHPIEEGADVLGLLWFYAQTQIDGGGAGAGGGGGRVKTGGDLGIIRQPRPGKVFAEETIYVLAP
ncbi:MAG TPA: hypothetical protein VGX78_16955, partial [Pirellulales bacterium]|nr:hypothetical protein [Pirellulales bacterium]